MRHQGGGEQSPPCPASVPARKLGRRRHLPHHLPGRYNRFMQAVEFTVELTDKPLVAIPRDVAAQLPASGVARVIILTGNDEEERQWRLGAYEQFARDDSPEDAVYDTL